MKCCRSWKLASGGCRAKVAVFEPRRLFGDFTGYGGVHPIADLGRTVSVTQQKHQFGDGTFGGAVVSADDAGLQQLQSGFVAVHLYRSALALRDVDDDDAPFGGFLQLADEPLFLRGIARAESLEHNGPYAGRMEHGVDDALLNAGEEGDDHDVGVEEVVGRHGARRVGAMDEMLVVADVYAYLCQYGIVVRTEGVEVFGIDFGGAVAAHQLVLEEDAHFGDNGGAVGMLGGGNLEGGDEVLLPVGAQGADGQLRARKDDGLAKVFEHKAKGGGGVCHRVRPVQYDEAVEVVVIVVDNLDDFRPVSRFHIRRVDGRVELIGCNTVVEALQLGHVDKQLVEVEGFERTGFCILYHSDGSTGINQQDGWIIDFHTT